MDPYNWLFNINTRLLYGVPQVRVLSTAEYQRCPPKNPEVLSVFKRGES